MCNFSHNYEPWMEVPPAPQKEPDANKNNKKAKSVPCKFFFEENCCLRGPECTFSHDPEVYSKFRSEHSKIEASKETNVY